MGDHFWPAVYPGLGVGLLYGLALGGWTNVATGAIGGLVAAVLGFVLFGSFLAEDGLLPLAVLLCLSLAGAFGGTRIVRLVTPRQTSKG